MGYAGPPSRKAAEVLSKYIVVDMYAKAVQGMAPEDAVQGGPRRAGKDLRLSRRGASSQARCVHPGASVPGIRPSACSGVAERWDPGNKCRDDSCGCEISVP